MKISDYDVSVAMDFITKWEGEEFLAYLCPAGVWTIGVGHTKGVKRGDHITREESQKLLREDLEGFQKELAPMVTVDVTKGQFIALMSFVFNLGTTAFRESTLRRRLNEGRYAEAADEFTKWVFAGGKRLDGLAKRRAAERKKFLEG